MRSEPKVSVAMPVFNTARYIGAAIESILAQSFGDFELVMLDDGSSDGSGEIAESYAANDNRLRVYHQANVGLTENRNRLLALARSDLVAWQDGDDESFPDRLARQVAFLDANPDCAYLGTAGEIHSDAGATRTLIPFTWHEQLCDRMLFGNSFFSGSIMLRKSAILDVGGYHDRPDVEVIEDFDMATRVAQRYRVANLADVLYRYRDNPVGYSNSNRVRQAENAARLAARLRSERTYRAFWSVPGYDAHRTLAIPDGLVPADAESYRRNVLTLNRQTIVALVRLGEIRAATARASCRLRRSFG